MYTVLACAKDFALVLLSQFRGLGKAATANEVQLLWHERRCGCAFSCILNSVIILLTFWIFLQKRGSGSETEAWSALLCPSSFAIYVYSVCVSSPDASTSGLLQGDPDFCSQGVLYQVVPISVLEILRSENLFPPELHGSWLRTGTKPVLLNWGFRSSPLPENMVYGMALVLIALCWVRTWGCRDLNLLLPASALFPLMSCMSEEHQFGPLASSAQWSSPLLGTTIVRLSPKAGETFEPSGSKAARSDILEAEVLLQATGVGQNLCWLRKRTEKHPWGLRFVSWCSRHLLMKRNCPLFGGESELQGNPLSDLCKGTAGATWA